MSSQPGDSTEPSFAVTSASSRSPATTSSMSRTERSCPIASGDIDCGNTTVSLSGRTGSAAGNLSSCCSSSGASKETSVISGRLPRAGGSRVQPDRDATARGAVDDGQFDRQYAVLEARARASRVDVLGEAHLALERPRLDLHLLVDATRLLRTLPLAGDQQQALPCVDLHGLRIDARQLHDDGQGVRVVRMEAVDVRAEAVPDAREAWDLPEVREQLLDLLLQLVHITACHRPEPYYPGLGSRIGRSGNGRLSARSCTERPARSRRRSRLRSTSRSGPAPTASARA